MKLLDKYILKNIIGPFLFGTSIVVFVFLMQFMIVQLEKLVGKGLDYSVILQLILLNVPWMLTLAAPMGVLFGSLMTFGNLAANHEITIVKASGGSLIRMMRSHIIFAIFLTIFMFWFNNNVLPESNHMSKVLLNDIKKKKPTFILESGRFTSELEGFTILPRRVDSLSGRMYQVTIYDESKPRQKNIISAKEGDLSFNQDYTKIILKLFNGQIHQSIYRSQKDYKIIDFDEYLISMDADGFVFERSGEDGLSRGQRELNVTAMIQIRDESIQKMKDNISKISEEVESHLDYLFLGKTDLENEDAVNNADKRLNFLKNSIRSETFKAKSFKTKSNQYNVEIQKKFTIPLACLIFVFVGGPLGVITKGGNFGVSAAISLGFYIIYWLFLIGGEKLADRGFLSPVLSMWSGNFILLIAGLLLSYRVSNESLKFISLRSKK